MEVVHHQAEDEMSDEEYERSRYEPGQLRPEHGGREFEPRMSRTGYVHQLNV